MVTVRVCHHGLLIVTRNTATRNKLRQSLPPGTTATTTTTTPARQQTAAATTRKRGISWHDGTRLTAATDCAGHVAPAAATAGQHRQAGIPEDIRGGASRQNGVQARLDVGRQSHQQHDLPEARHALCRHDRVRRRQRRPSADGGRPLRAGHRSRSQGPRRLLREVL